MPYVIYDPVNNLYLKQAFGASPTWAPDLLHASQFKTEQRANNFITHTIVFRDTDIDAKTLLVQSLEQADTAESIRQNKAIFSPSYARQLLDELPMLVDELLGAVEIVEKLTEYYQKVLKDTELASIDLLHKIEFSDPEVVPGFLLYSQLRETRLNRRVAKDGLEVLQLFREVGIVDAVRRLWSLTKQTLSQHENRSYSPRVLKDLFETFPPVSPNGPSKAVPSEKNESSITIEQIIAYEGDTATAAPPETDMEPAALPAPEAHDAPPETPEEAPALPEPVEPPRRRRTANARTWTPSALGQRRSNRHTPAPLVRRYRKA